MANTPSVWDQGIKMCTTYLIYWNTPNRGKLASENLYTSHLGIVVKIPFHYEMNWCKLINIYFFGKHCAENQRFSDELICSNSFHNGRGFWQQHLIETYQTDKLASATEYILYTGH